MLAHEQVIEIRDKHKKILERYIYNYHRNLEKELQPVLYKLIKCLQKKYPKRCITLDVCNGYIFVKFNGNSKYNPFVDDENYLEYYPDKTHRLYRLLGERHPLKQLYRALEEMYDINGQVVHIEPIK